jgi:acyl carrier protein
MSDIEATVIAVIADTFSVDPGEICRDTTADDVDGWDSLAHTILMMRLERALGLKIDEATASGAANVGELIDGLEALSR